MSLQSGLDALKDKRYEEAVELLEQFCCDCADGCAKVNVFIPRRSPPTPLKKGGLKPSLYPLFKGGRRRRGDLNRTVLTAIAFVTTAIPFATTVIAFVTTATPFATTAIAFVTTAIPFATTAIALVD